jgi:hypothetical protein
MRIRIRLRRGQPLRRKPQKNRHVALAFGALLTPAALMAYVLGFWRLAADMGVAGAFGISGFFSHWQIWILLGVMLQFGGHALNRYGRDGALHVPRPLMFFAYSARSRKDHDAAVSPPKAGSR